MSKTLNDKKAEIFKALSNPATDNNDRLTALIQSAYHKTGKKVVVIIDEYDRAGLADAIADNIF